MNAQAFPLCLSLCFTIMWHGASCFLVWCSQSVDVRMNARINAMQNNQSGQSFRRFEVFDAPENNSKYMPLALWEPDVPRRQRLHCLQTSFFFHFLLSVFGTFPGAPGTTPRLRQGGPAPGAPLLEVLHLSPQD